MKTEQELKAMNLTEQKAYAKDIGLDIKGNLKEDEIVKRIMDKQSSPDFIDPNPDQVDAEIPLEGADLIEDKVLVLDSGHEFTRGEVVKAAVRDAGLTHEEWNKLPEKQKDETLQEFIDQTNFVHEAPEPIDEGNYKADYKRLAAVMEEFPDVKFETEENFWTLNYRGHIISGNVTIPDVVLRRQVRALMQDE